MEKVLAIGLLFAFSQSFGQNLHPNYKAQMNPNLKQTNYLSKEILENPIQEKSIYTAPKYKKQPVNIQLDDQSKGTKHKNYKQHATGK